MSLKTKRLTKGIVLEKNNAERGITLTLEHDAANNRASYTVKTPALSAGAALVLDLPDTGTVLLSDTNTENVQNKTLDNTNTINGATIVDPILSVNDITLTKETTPTNPAAGKAKLFVSSVNDELSTVDNTGTVRKYLPSTAGLSKVYATDGAGAQTTLDYSSSAVVNAVGLRTSDGQMKAVTLPDANGSASSADLTTRAYVQAAVGATIALTTVALPNNATTTFYTTPYVTNTVLHFAYSIVRGTGYEAGRITVITDGTLVAVAQGSVASLNSVGVTVLASISGSDLIVQGLTTNTGVAASIKFQISPWLA